MFIKVVAGAISLTFSKFTAKKEKNVNGLCRTSTVHKENQVDSVLFFKIKEYYHTISKDFTNQQTNDVVRAVRKPFRISEKGSFEMLAC